ncbi:MAG: HEPN domain-containing protein [Gemmatimonadota bacterium]
MPPEVRDPSDPGEWLRRARADFALARTGRTAPEVLYEDLCFHAQQAAEKAIKALLVMRQLEFPKTHMLEQLLDLARRAGVEIPAEVRQSARLSDYATGARYPGGAEDVTEDDYRKAIELAELVLRWAEDAVRKS